MSITQNIIVPLINNLEFSNAFVILILVHYDNWGPLYTISTLGLNYYIMFF